MSSHVRALRIAMIVTGLLCFTPGLMMWIWPSGWRWEPGHAHYEQMIIGIYATLGVFLIIAARDPLRHRLLIGFTIWSSLVHGGIMLAQSFTAAAHHGHLVGDVPVLFAVAAVLAVLTRRAARAGT